MDKLRAKWELYADRLRRGDDNGSLVGASFLIAKSGVTDVVVLLDRLGRYEAVVAAARALISWPSFPAASTIEEREAGCGSGCTGGRRVSERGMCSCGEPSTPLARILADKVARLTSDPDWQRQIAESEAAIVEGRLGEPISGEELRACILSETPSEETT